MIRKWGGILSKEVGAFFNFNLNEKLFANLTEKQWNILNAALEVFTEKGYSAATTSEIARKAGVAEGTIFRHFRQKKDILLALLVPLLQNVVGPHAVNSLNQIIIEYQDQPTEDVLALILENRYKLFVENQKLLRLVITESQYHPELKDALTKAVIYKSKESFIKFIEVKQRQGEIRQDIEAWALVRSLFGMLILYILSKGIFSEKEKVQNAKEEIKTIVELFLHGARA